MTGELANPRNSRPAIVVVSVLALLSFAACDWRAHWLADNQKEIDDGTAAIAAAKDDAGRARALSSRGYAYGERARYSRTMNLIPPEAGGKLYDLAIEDHDRAVALAPRDVRVQIHRGMTLYNRAAQSPAGPEARKLFDAAAAAFTAALEVDGMNEQALDMRGVIHQQCGDFDLAIEDFTRLTTIDRKLGRLRLADAYCNRAAAHQKQNESRLAIADYEKSIEVGVATDGCECQPDSPLAWLYLEAQDYYRARQVVDRARVARRFIMPEVVEKLEKSASARVVR